MNRLGSRRRVDGECNLTDELVNGYLGGSRTCCPETQRELNSLLQAFDVLGGVPRVAECIKTGAAVSCTEYFLDAICYSVH